MAVQRTRTERKPEPFKERTWPDDRPERPDANFRLNVDQSITPTAMYRPPSASGTISPSTTTVRPVNVPDNSMDTKPPRWALVSTTVSLIADSVPLAR